ncbi:protein Wnt-11b-2-like [Paramacrobiotus metropolitanus]|uniref:protein Wnt-11b-2-like n=1 Tax=Paramacrobiotus metropolitanus TaxID=2943436 RepID=UPI0024458AF2|nr:protein Wnt-11b-2-like [Paramacrobiotus metropolitanus]
MNFSCVTFMPMLWIITGFLDGSTAIKWLSLHKLNISWSSGYNYYLCHQAFKFRALDKGQKYYCKRYFETMPYIVSSAKDTSTACQRQFFYQRWNCSSVEKAPNYRNDLKLGTREQAYLSALSAATVVHTIAKACAAGFLQNCNCGPMPNEPPATDFKWGGCGDDVSYGMKVGRFFTDIPYNQNFQLSRSSKQLKQLWKKNRLTRAALSLHNQHTGRRMVADSLTRHCKCHGVSGSCQIRTCWKSLPPMKEISHRLFRNYKRAVEVRYQSNSASFEPLFPLISAPTSDTLLYTAKSPDYCNADDRFGSMGTKNRLCNATSSGPESCKTMCCGRGHYSYMMHVPVTCNCKYIWCCRVECNTCQQWVHVTRCK